MTRLILLASLLICIATKAQLPQPVLLPNGWSLSPAGRFLPLGDLPLNIAISPNQQYLAVTNNGQSIQSIQLINPNTEKILDTVIVPKAWYGLAFSENGKTLYASGGNDNTILRFSINQDTLTALPSISLGEPWPNRISPSGIAIDDRRKILYVVTKENNSLYTIDLNTNQIRDQRKLQGEAYTCLLSPNKRFLYISLWGADKIAVLDTRKNTIQEWPVGDNPNELCLSQNGKYLFVANANDNSVSVMDTRYGKVLETLNTALFPNSPSGSTSNGVALNASEDRLYVANADNNCLAVFNVSKPGQSSSMGFIPTGWYPTQVKFLNGKLFIANGKGFRSMANPYGPNPIEKKEKVIYQGADNRETNEVQYIGGLFKGSMSILEEPDVITLANWSAAVYKNTPFSADQLKLAQGEPGNPIPMKIGNPSPIKYVFYIIKENRTYDQVLADIPEGNGDTSLLLFGEQITPNQHALAREFVLLDNFYVDGEVSADGHNWSLGAYATDYLEKTWPTSYGGRGGDYDAEGNRAIANNKQGFIWDNCLRNGITYRTYGEFADNYKANLPVLENHFCPYYTSWDETVRDTTRFYQWKREFDSLLAVNAVPQLNTLRFINDHTEGVNPGRPTPFAHVADNDLAVGLFVEHLSKSKIWKETAIFIVEDDAQNGPDHIDAHRTTAYVAGGFVKRGFVDHTLYSTSSMLRTIELILGLPPMSQFDAAATPMWRSFQSTPDLHPFRARAANVDLTEVNPQKMSALVKKSLTFDFSKEDAAPDLEFSEVIWKAIKGEHSPMPAPRRAAFLKANNTEEEDDRP